MPVASLYAFMGTAEEEADSTGKTSEAAIEKRIKEDIKKLKEEKRKIIEERQEAQDDDNLTRKKPFISTLSPEEIEAASRIEKEKVEPTESRIVVMISQILKTMLILLFIVFAFYQFYNILAKRIKRL